MLPSALLPREWELLEREKPPQNRACCCNAQLLHVCVTYKRSKEAKSVAGQKVTLSPERGLEGPAEELIVLPAVRSVQRVVAGLQGVPAPLFTSALL
ncbi:hypothetical protein NDU88_010224 [Pleurodeles waltl]|uniref:Uncharacterized protein n=1 Tax=Pleurodeles waltl TaxID=8319 RepID=A0AAV7S2N7_PLEWA|nr:hypothetical protein NDU88_010224 [Pleurodeles waltl]